MTESELEAMLLNHDVVIFGEQDKDKGVWRDGLYQSVPSIRRTVDSIKRIVIWGFAGLALIGFWNALHLANNPSLINFVIDVLKGMTK